MFLGTDANDTLPAAVEGCTGSAVRPRQTDRKDHRERRESLVKYLFINELKGINTYKGSRGEATWAGSQGGTGNQIDFMFASSVAVATNVFIIDPLVPRSDHKTVWATYEYSEAFC